jgi:hypothetical protein
VLNEWKVVDSEEVQGEEDKWQEHFLRKDRNR